MNSRGPSLWHASKRAGLLGVTMFTLVRLVGFAFEKNVFAKHLAYWVVLATVVAIVWTAIVVMLRKSKE